MKSETTASSPSISPAPDDRATPEQLTGLLHALRGATSEIHSALRKSLLAEGNVLMSPPPQAHIRRGRQLEKAHELSRQAEAKLELLVAHFGGLL
jgi:hypothetical protein